MSITLVGGMDRLDRHYKKEAVRFGHKLKIFSQAASGLGGNISRADALVLFTNKVSHQARNEAVTAAKKAGIPIFMYHSCGICTLRECFEGIEKVEGAAV